MQQMKKKPYIEFEKKSTTNQKSVDNSFARKKERENSLYDFLISSGNILFTYLY